VIPVVCQPEPKAPDYDFHRDVYERGEDTIRQLAGLDPLRVWPGPKLKPRVSRIADVTGAMLADYPHWTRALPALHESYNGLCAYLARRIELVETPTADHYIARHRASPLMLAYTWSNLRLSHQYINGVKSDLARVLDPFEVKDGWFALNLSDGVTVPGPDAPPDRLVDIQRTITLLHLDHGPVVKTRKRAIDRYRLPPAGQPPIPLWSLAEDEPFVAHELRRQGQLNPGDG
jgi:hypothetical protein